MMALTGVENGWSTKCGLIPLYTSLLKGLNCPVQVEQKVEQIETGGDKVIKFSIAGYSLGGLVARYAIGYVTPLSLPVSFTERIIRSLHQRRFFDNVEPVNFNTFATPHIGLLRYSTFFSRVTNTMGPILLSRTGEQFYAVEGHLFCVPRKAFEESLFFMHKFNLRGADTVFPSLGTEEDVVHLSGVKTDEFRAFLEVLYPHALYVSLYAITMHNANQNSSRTDLMKFGTTVKLAEPEWLYVLRLAHDWKFNGVREQAISELKNASSFDSNPVYKIELAKKYNITAWLFPAYRALAIREEPLNIKEMTSLGFEDVSKVSIARDRILRAKIAGSRGGSEEKIVQDSISELFGVGDTETAAVQPVRRKVAFVENKETNAKPTVENASEISIPKEKKRAVVLAGQWSKYQCNR